MPSSVHLEASFQKPSSTSSTFDKAEVFSEELRPSFRWPGIEAIMESYECHISGMNNIFPIVCQLHVSKTYKTHLCWYIVIISTSKIETYLARSQFQ